MESMGASHRSCWLALVLVLATCKPFAADGALADAGRDVDAHPPDAAVDRDAGFESDAGLPASDPMQIACVPASCTAGAERCCVDVDPTKVRCEAAGSNNCFGSEVNCDETDDCANGSVCCLTNDNADPTWSTYCQPSCAATDAQLCRTNSECAGRPCLPIACGERTFGSCDGVKPAVCP